MMEADDGDLTDTCPCCKSCIDCTTGFEKVVDLKNAGLVIYHHKIKSESVNQNPGVIASGTKTTEDVFILHNTKDTEITSTDFLPEIEKREITCARCRQIMEHALKLLRKVPAINRNDIRGICDHCKLKNQPCYDCEETVKKFFFSKTEAKDFVFTKDRVREWLSKIKNVIKDENETGKDRKRPHRELRINQLCSRASAKGDRKLDITELFHEPGRPGLARGLPKTSESSKKQIVFKLDDPELEKHELPSIFMEPSGNKRKIAIQKDGDITFLPDDDQYYASDLNNDVEKTVSPETIRDHYEAQRMTKEKQRFFKEVPMVPFQSEEDFFTQKQKNITIDETDIEKTFPKQPELQRRQYYEDDILPAGYSRQYMHETEKVRKQDQKAIDEQYIVGREKDLSLDSKLPVKSAAIVGKHRSKEDILPSAHVKEEALPKYFSFSFPQDKEVEIQIKQQKSSSELIKDTQDKLQAKAEEDKRRIEEERKRKHEEEEEKKRIAREEKIKLSDEKKRLAEEKIKFEEETKLKEKERRHEEYQKILDQIETEDEKKTKMLSRASSTGIMESKTEESKSKLESKPDLKKLETRPKEHLTESTSKVTTTETKGQKSEPKEPTAKLKESGPEPKKSKSELKMPKSSQKEPLSEVKEPKLGKPSKSEQKESKSTVKRSKSEESKVPKSIQKEPISEGKESKLGKESKSEPKRSKSESKVPNSIQKEPFSERKEPILGKDIKSEPKESKSVPKESKPEPKTSKSESKEPKSESKEPQSESKGSKSEPSGSKSESRGSKSEPKMPKSDQFAKKDLMSPNEPKSTFKTTESATKEPKPGFKKPDLTSKESKLPPKALKSEPKEQTSGTKEPKSESYKSKFEKGPKSDKNVLKAEKDVKQGEKEQQVEVKLDKIAANMKAEKTATQKDDKQILKEAKESKAKKPAPVSDEMRVPRRKKEVQLEVEEVKPKPEKKKDINLKDIKMLTPSQNFVVLDLVKFKRADEKSKYDAILKLMTKSQIQTHEHCHKNIKAHKCLMCINSDMELVYESKKKKPDNYSEMVKGSKIYKYYKPPAHIESDRAIVPLLFNTKYDVPIFEKKEAADHPPADEITPQTGKPTKMPEPEAKGVIRYALSDRTFIEKGWTMLPTEKVVRKMNVYRMRPAHPEFDWFEHNKNKRLMLYDTGERLAEFDDNGRGRWYYRNGRLALDYYDAEELNAQQRFVIYSNGEPDERGRSRPYTILATFDYLGNGIVFDHGGKIRLKYNQTEGVVLDRNIGPVSHWKWHTLNDPPVLQQVMIDTQMAQKDPSILKMGGVHDNKPRPDNEEMLAIEFDNFIKEKSKKLTQTFKPFQIRMKALKINEHFSLKVLDQATVYLIYRDGTTNLKLNIGMILDHKEIVDTNTAELGEVSNNLEKVPARSDSLAQLQKSAAYAERFERTRTERERRLRPTQPSASVDKLTAAASRPMRHPLPTVLSSSTSATTTTNYKIRKPSSNNVYYDNRLF